MAETKYPDRNSNLIGAKYYFSFFIENLLSLKSSFFPPLLSFLAMHIRSLMPTLLNHEKKGKTMWKTVKWGHLTLPATLHCYIHIFHIKPRHITSGPHSNPVGGNRRQFGDAVCLAIIQSDKLGIILFYELKGFAGRNPEILAVDRISTSSREWSALDD